LKFALSFIVAFQHGVIYTLHYRDFVISLARTGEIAEAERILEMARLLDT